MKRIVSIWLPQWPVERLRRASADQPQTTPDLPFVLAETQNNALRVSAANEAARALGVEPGLGLADARARVPHLLSAPAEPEADRRALLALARWCNRYAPSFNIDGIDGLWIDISGAAHLLGGEEPLLRDLESRLESLGFTARIGLADTPGCAWALARYGLTSPAISLPGAQGKALQSLPVEALRLDAATVTLLRRLGLKQIGQLADIFRTSLQRRFPSKEIARAVLMRLDQALGSLREPLRPLDPLPCYDARLAFAEPLISHQGVTAALRKLAQDLCGRLARAGVGAKTVTFTVCRADGTAAALRTGFAAPCRSAAHMARLMAEKIDRIDAGPGIDAMSFAALGVESLSATQDTFTAPGHTRSLAPLVDRLSNRFEPMRVLRAAPFESHIPERAQRYRTAMQPLVLSEAEAPPLAPPRPALLLERPEPIDVLAEVPEGPPLRFTWRRARHLVSRWQGPERIAGEWWRLIATPSRGPLQHTRDYYRIEDDAGRRYWVFRAGLYGSTEDGPPRWYLHGVMG